LISSSIKKKSPKILLILLSVLTINALGSKNLLRILLKSCLLTFIGHYQILHQYLVKALPRLGNTFTKARRRRYQASAAALPRHGGIADNE